MMSSNGSLKLLSKELREVIKEPMEALKVREKRIAMRMRLMRRKRKKLRKVLAAQQRLKSAKLHKLMETIT